MKTYHVNDDNQVGICDAKYRQCKFGNHTHFSDKGRAQELADLKMSALSKFNTVSKKAKVLLSEELVSKGRTPSYKQSNSADYEELWSYDETGKPAVYSKVNHRIWNMDDKDYVDGILICNLETNPKTRGNNHAISFLRNLKKEYGVDAIYTTGSFSREGYKFFLRVQEIEKETGETLMKIAPGEEIHIDPYDQHNFVDNWEEERSKYPVD